MSAIKFFFNEIVKKSGSNKINISFFLRMSHCWSVCVAESTKTKMLLHSLLFLISLSSLLSLSSSQQVGSLTPENHPQLSVQVSLPSSLPFQDVWFLVEFVIFSSSSELCERRDMPDPADVCGVGLKLAVGSLDLRVSELLHRQPVGYKPLSGSR